MADLATYNAVLRAAAQHLTEFETHCDAVAGVDALGDIELRRGHANGEFAEPLAGAIGDLSYSTITGLVFQPPGASSTPRKDFGQLPATTLQAMLEACPALYQQMLDFDVNPAPVQTDIDAIRVFLDSL